MWSSSFVLALSAFLSFVYAQTPKGLRDPRDRERSPPTARLDSGPIVGTVTSVPSATASVVNKFLGIPFADSPPKRFAPPSRPKGWVLPRDTKQFKPACIQQFNNGPNRNFTTSVFNNPAPKESEDCLYLNVYQPDARAKAPGRAVLFWLYGGSLQFGTGSLPGYDGSYLAAHQDVIVVTINYRTNVFGFPGAGADELPLKERNLGFLDQRAALAWVQKNIGEFGGDPTRVTIFGESAGAVSVDALITSYNATSKPPFHAGILQSGQVSIRRATASNTSSSWGILAHEIGCAGNRTLTCLRRAPAGKIKSIIEAKSLSFGPITDNVTLVSSPLERRRRGQIANIPVMTGSDAEEGRVFQVGQNNITKYLQTTFPNNPGLQESVRAAYPLGKDGLNTEYDVVSQIMTDLQFTCPTKFFAEASAAGGYPTWRYYFNATFPNLQTFSNAGVYHSSEIDLVFGTYGKLGTQISSRPSPANEVQLSDFMQGAWAKMAKSPRNGPGWNKVGSGNEYVGVLGDLSVTVVNPSAIDTKCSLYSSLY